MSDEPRLAVIASGKPQGLHQAAQELLAAGIQAQLLPPPDGQTNS